ncbi:hypothetical protein WALSEDRAFT_33099 [Wallemia mellicola CBS 633.66]|uniref:Uncharacterized protein n=1 Tax=Wallemia mellicola (strain ATCC MYA-4683 / CBS 633.66) TaxID=671144 RepID=I4YAB0_WALMC|nr:hypothetical protein WALSEDRAFT_33099 [Wallemia mellicola CBS 633.66]EIM20902.1 hypothetical protein WALSEDRAFT_33099 [Wallemia mellicola CBS 633.66]|eukprot:XP_006959161.1 hypothetical protein WALSEDRAFT_33099 [Wallemia mellicola CBS 633.66]
MVQDKVAKRSLDKSTESDKRSKEGKEDKSVLAILIVGMCKTLLVITMVPFFAITIGVSAYVVLKVVMTVLSDGLEHVK